MQKKGVEKKNEKWAWRIEHTKYKTDRSEENNTRTASWVQGAVGKRSVKDDKRKARNNENT